MQKFATPAPIAAVLDIPAGSIRFIAADRADTTVEVLPADASKGRDVQAAEQTEVEYGDGVLRIAVPAPKNQIFGNSGSVEVTVQLPADSRVEAKAASARAPGVGRLGDVTFEGAQGTVKLDETASARLALRRRRRLGRPPRRPRRDQHPEGRHPDRRGHARHGHPDAPSTARSPSAPPAASPPPWTPAPPTAGSTTPSTNTEGDAARLTLHATTSYGDITARSL
ncbi:hypothetical protein STANM309S_04938 [Streptomyces tanashiensis]